MTNEIHFIEKSAAYERVNGTSSGEWKTGTWKVSTEKAEKLIGGHIFLHTSQKDPCYLGGVILGYEPAKDEPGRVWFHFKFDPCVIGTRTTADHGKWSVEQLRVWKSLDAAA